MFAGTDGPDKDAGGGAGPPGVGPWSLYGKPPPGVPGSLATAASMSMSMNPVFQPLFQMASNNQQAPPNSQSQQQLSSQPPSVSTPTVITPQTQQTPSSANGNPNASVFQHHPPPPIMLLPIATPISPAHSLLVQAHQTSRNSAAPHQRARAAAQLARNLGSTPLTNQFDPNAPAAPRPNAAAVAAAAAMRTGEGDPNSLGSGSMPSLSGTPTGSVITTTGGTNSVSNPPSGGSTSWTVLDVGGLNIRNVSPAMFNYTFLTMLYLNHNNLTSLPSAIERLRSLVLLDVSGNRLTNVPCEVGMLVNLQCLYLFDNQLSSLPWEIGNLYQLETLGIEGNPIQDSLTSIIQKDGTNALISYLRDHAPVGPQPPEREWIVLETQPPAGPSETCSVFSYNILAEKLATAKMYGYTPSWALEWTYRSDAILQEILQYSADIVCLQEVEMQAHENFFQPQLRDLGGYESVFWPKTRARTMSDWERKSVDGCATFFRTSKYVLVDQQVVEFNQMALQKPDFKKTEDVYNRLMTKDNVAVLALLQNVESRSHILVANCHIHWDPTYRDVKLVQVAMLMEQLELACAKYSRELAAPDLSTAAHTPIGIAAAAAAAANRGNNGNNGIGALPIIPVLICGDFNSTPESGVYELLRSGRVDKAHSDFQAYNYGNYTKDGLSHRMSLKSAYADAKVSFTNLTSQFVGVIDYIWYTNNSLSVIGLLGGIDRAYTRKCIGFPNAHFPSDHIPLLAEFRLCK